MKSRWCRWRTARQVGVRDWTSPCIGDHIWPIALHRIVNLLLEYGSSSPCSNLAKKEYKYLSICMFFGAVRTLGARKIRTCINGLVIKKCLYPIDKSVRWLHHSWLLPRKCTGKFFQNRSSGELRFWIWYYAIPWKVVVWFCCLWMREGKRFKGKQFISVSHFCL